MEIINGIVIFCFAFLLLLLISFSNFIFGILIIPFSLGLVERDGVLIIVGYIEAIIYINFVYLLIATTIKTFFVLKIFDVNNLIFSYPFRRFDFHNILNVFSNQSSRQRRGYRNFIFFQIRFIYTYNLIGDFGLSF